MQRRRLKLSALLGLLLLAAYLAHRSHQSESQLDTRLAAIVTAQPETIVDCTSMLHPRPLVLLALGQSNAGNHGSLSKSEEAPIAMLTGTDCVETNDPLPGATGRGGSIWRHLPALLNEGLAGRKVLISVLAVDATTIDDWTRPGSRLRARLVAQIQALKRHGLKPDFVLWQQGEADALNGTPSSAYLKGLDQLAAILDQTGVGAPLVLARSTVCRTHPGADVRGAIDQAVAGNPRFLLGPDTDSLLGDMYRSDGCHLNASGLKNAAKAWASVLKMLAVGAPYPA